MKQDNRFQKSHPSAPLFSSERHFLKQTDIFTFNQHLNRVIKSK